MTGLESDLILRGGTVYCCDGARTSAQAVAIKNSMIMAIGTNAQMAGLTGRRTEVIDLRGRLLLPGFIDAHVHAAAAGLERLECNLADVHSLTDYLTVVGRYAQSRPDARWITGGGWALDVFPGGLAYRHDLDRVVPDRPVFLSNRDHHAAWVNTRALELAGLDDRTPDPPDGRIEREPDGTPAGTLQEGAMRLVGRLAPRPDAAQLAAGIAEGQRYLHALGITGWQEAIIGDYAVVPDCFDGYLLADQQGLLDGRVTGALWWQRGAGVGQLDGLIERRERAGESGRFRASTIKIMLDGVCENFTASMLAPYLDGHAGETENSGTRFFEPADLNQAVTAIDTAGFQVHFHAIGDRAVREALDAVAAARAANGPGHGRHHIAHLQVVHPDDLPRFRQLEVTANCQALWACEEPQMTELTLPFLGPQRSGWQYPFGSLLRAGAQLCMGSDWPVSSPDPLWQIHVAVNRTVPPGYPYAPAGPGRVFLPQQRIGLHEAIAAFTRGSAYVNHADHISGSIEPGKAADLVVLDRDLFAGPAEEIALARVDLTLASGRIVYDRLAA